MRINRKKWVPIALAIVLLLSMGMAIPVAAEEMQAEDEECSFGNDEGHNAIDAECRVGDGIYPEIDMMPYRLVNPDYVPEEFVILRTGGEFTVDDIESDYEQLLAKLNKVRKKDRNNRYLGYFIPIVENDDTIANATITTYGIAVRPDGFIEQYFSLDQADTGIDGSTGVVTRDAGRSADSLKGALEWKESAISELSGFSMTMSEPDAIGITFIDGFIDSSHGYSDDYGHIRLSTTYYWDSCEQDPQYDYFITKSTVMTQPGNRIYGNGYMNDMFELIHDWEKVKVGDPLPGATLIEYQPTATTGEQTVTLGLSTQATYLQWTTRIPEFQIIDGSLLYLERSWWAEDFNPKTSAASQSYLFTAGSRALCKQRDSRTGDQYVVCSAFVKFKNGWSKKGLFFSRTYGPDSGCTTIGTSMITRFKNSRYT